MLSDRGDWPGRTDGTVPRRARPGYFGAADFASSWIVVPPGGATIFTSPPGSSPCGFELSPHPLSNDVRPIEDAEAREHQISTRKHDSERLLQKETTRAPGWLSPRRSPGLENATAGETPAAPRCDPRRRPGRASGRWNQ